MGKNTYVTSLYLHTSLEYKITYLYANIPKITVANPQNYASQLNRNI